MVFINSVTRCLWVRRLYQMVLPFYWMCDYHQEWCVVNNLYLNAWNCFHNQWQVTDWGVSLFWFCFLYHHKQPDSFLWRGSGYISHSKRSFKQNLDALNNPICRYLLMSVQSWPVMFFLFCYVGYDQFAMCSTDCNDSTVHVIFFYKKLKNTGVMAPVNDLDFTTEVPYKELPPCQRWRWCCEVYSSRRWPCQDKNGDKWFFFVYLEHTEI